MSGSQHPFTPNTASALAATRLAVGTISAAAALPAGNGFQLRLFNLTGQPCYIAFGGSDVVATVNSMFFPGFWFEVLTIPSVGITHVAAISASGTTTLELVKGSGL